MGSTNPATARAADLTAVFAPLLGQPAAVELLTQAVAQQRIAPAYLFMGPPGVGRGLAARCWLELLLRPVDGSPTKLATLSQRLAAANHPDLLWVEPTFLHQGKRLTRAEAEAAGLKRKTPPAIRLEQVREVAQFLGRSPLEAARSVVVLEQAETLNEAAANGLLKTLEEPGQASLILIAPSPEALLPTLVSRCQKIPFSRLPPPRLSQVLNQVLPPAEATEILQQLEILQLAQGSPGEALLHWHRLQEMPPELLALASQWPTSPRQALELARQIDKALDPEAQLWLVGYLQQRLWHHSPSPTVVQTLQQLEQIRLYLRQNVQPRLVWEVTLLKLVHR
jgi:DNA polymerase III subunit delta'